MTRPKKHHILAWVFFLALAYLAYRIFLRAKTDVQKTVPEIIQAALYDTLMSPFAWLSSLGISGLSSVAATMKSFLDQIWTGLMNVLNIFNSGAPGPGQPGSATTTVGSAAALANQVTLAQDSNAGLPPGFSTGDFVMRKSTGEYAWGF